MKQFRSLMAEGSKEEYQKFFNKKLAKWKIKSPAELSDEDKKKFFDEIEKEWTKDEAASCEDDEEMEEGAFIISKDTKFTAQQISDVGNKIGIARPKLKKLVTELNKFHG